MSSLAGWPQLLPASARSGAGVRCRHGAERRLDRVKKVLTTQITSRFSSVQVGGS